MEDGSSPRIHHGTGGDFVPDRAAFRLDVRKAMEFLGAFLEKVQDQGVLWLAVEGDL